MGKRFWTLDEVARITGETAEDIRRRVVEDRTLRASVVMWNGESFPYEPIGLSRHPRCEPDELGEVIDFYTGKKIGNLRILGKDFAELLRLKSDTWRKDPPLMGEVPRAEAVEKTPPAIAVTETVEQRLAKILRLVEEEEKIRKHGAQARVAKRLKMDNSKLSKDLAKARRAKKNPWTSTFNALKR
jgi:hypothetical protein